MLIFRYQGSTDPPGGPKRVVQGKMAPKAAMNMNGIVMRNDGILLKSTLNISAVISFIFIHLFMIYSRTIIAVEASGRDCTNNKELFHKIGV